MNTEPKSSGERVKVESDLSNYATKSDLKNATGVATSTFAKKVDLARLDLSQLKSEYLNHLYSKFWYKSKKLMTCSFVQEKCYK